MLELSGKPFRGTFAGAHVLELPFGKPFREPFPETFPGSLSGKPFQELMLEHPQGPKLELQFHGHQIAIDVMDGPLMAMNAIKGH